MSSKSTSHKASVEDRLLANIDLIDASQACVLLRIETDDPQGVLRAMARGGAIIALVHDGKTMAPLFQFDAELGRVFDVVRHILMLRPSRISNLRLAYWMTRPHVDFGGPPAERLGIDDEAIIAAFRRYIELVRHG